MSAARRGGANGGAAAGGWLHAAWLALTGATQAQLLSEEVAGGGSGGLSLPALTARSNSHYERVSTEESDGDDTSWESSETEQFLLTREGDPKTTTNSPEIIVTCDELRMSKPEFWSWSAKKKRGESESMVVEESEAFLPRRRWAKQINDVEVNDHPLSFDRQGRRDHESSSFLLLSFS